MEPIYPAVAAAQAEGTVSNRHAHVIVNAIEKLPDAIRAEMDRTVEGILLDVARHYDPRFLQSHADELRNCLDPDGLLRDHEHRNKHRDLQLARRPDGTAHLSGDLTAECAEHLHTQLDALTRPKPTTSTDSTDGSTAEDGSSTPIGGAGGPDPRTPGQPPP